MSYVNQNDLSREIGPTDLAYLTGDVSGLVVNSDRVSHAISSASALINSYLFGIYDVPFILPVDEVIYQLSLDLTVSYLYEYEYRETFIPVPIIQRKLSAIKKLIQLQKGEIILLLNPREDSKKTILLNKDSIINENYLDDM